MRKLLLSAAVLGLISTPPAMAQAPQRVAAGANAAQFRVAVVDISYIFKSYPQFTAQLATLKTEMEAADSALKADRDRIVKSEEGRNAMKPGSAEFKAADEELARLKADFTIKQGTIRRDFLERESKIYYQTYMTVSNAVADFAQRNGIGMVLRFNGDPCDASQREDVMRAIMQPIVFQNSIDITPDILAVLGRGGAGAAAPAGTPTASRPAPAGAGIPGRQ